MKCPFCRHKKTRVINKRETIDLAITRRRRECPRCSRRFTTYERIEGFEINVIKRDGRKEPFNHEKLMQGISKACSKRPVSNEQLERIISEIESSLKKIKKGEVKSNLIGELVMKKLRRLDLVAYMRFASVYKGFENVSSFEEEIKTLKREGFQKLQKFKG